MDGNDDQDKPDQIGSYASSTTSAASAQPTCELDTWGAPGFATIRLDDVALQVSVVHGPRPWDSGADRGDSGGQPTSETRL